MTLKQFIGWSALVILGVFIALNLHHVEIYFGFGNVIRMPVGVVVIVSALLGAAAVAAFRIINKPPPKS